MVASPRESSWKDRMVTSAQTDVAIIGAGPYGLSIAAHLAAAGIEHRVFGTPMEFWRRHMPPGMLLKSYGDSSNLFDPQSLFTLEEFSRHRAIDYHASHVPVRLASFVAYGQAFQERFVPQVKAKRLVSQRLTAAGHELRFDDDETIIARHVVLALGMLPFKHTPSVLTALPEHLISHSSAYGPLQALRGKEITIIGSGSSALDLAALLSLEGSAVTIVARAARIHFQRVPEPPRSLLKRIHAPTARGLGAGWLLRVCADAPQLIRLLPDRARSTILENTLGPSGGYFIRRQIEQAVALKLGCTIERATTRGDRVQLLIVDRGGRRETIESDHVLAATGYRVDVRRLGFLSRETIDRLRAADQTPLLSSNFESSVPRLYFVGLASARSFGPVMRFVVGARHSATRLARWLPRSMGRQATWVSTAVPD
jgi:Pyridine nucleotide-disulphide oxidoreductase